MLIMDSGLGGLSVVRAMRAIAPGLPLSYLADTAGFPYGNRRAEDITARALAAIHAVAANAHFTTVVLACNTLSTLSLHALRAQLPYRFIGTVPAIKVAAAQSRSRRFTLLATPNTAHSAYSKQLIAEFAADCTVDCYGAPNLAVMAEQALLGAPLNEEALRAELAPAFHDDARGKTDAVILGCTHYPLLLPQLQQLAPWKVQWIDSAHAIARHALTPMPAMTASPSVAYLTAANAMARYAPLFTVEGFAATQPISVSAG